MIRTGVRALLVLLALIVALLVETAVLPTSRLLPVSPSLVLLVVLATAWVSGPNAGAAAGFAGGFLLDVAPPAVISLGTTAFVLTVVGAACGYVQLLPVRSAVWKVPLVVGLVASGTLLWVAGMSAMNEIMRPGATGASWANAAQLVGPLVLLHLAGCPVVFPAVSRLIHLVALAPAQAQQLLPTQRGQAHVRAAASNLASRAGAGAAISPAMIRKSR